jgi:cupin fold WbuC family metalloprotein
MAVVQAIGAHVIAELGRQAVAAERRRAHLLLHSGHDDQVQRLLIVLQPGSYVRPHHHSEQWEMLVLLQGRGRVLHFSETGRLLGYAEMSSAAPIAQIPIGSWHGFVVMEPVTAVMEIKPGPYRANEFAPWSPAEGDPDVPRCLEWLEQADIGKSWRTS